MCDLPLIDGSGSAVSDTRSGGSVRGSERDGLGGDISGSGGKAMRRVESSGTAASSSSADTRTGVGDEPLLPRFHPFESENDESPLLLLSLFGASVMWLLLAACDTPPPASALPAPTPKKAEVDVLARGHTGRGTS